MALAVADDIIKDNGKRSNMNDPECKARSKAGKIPFLGDCKKTKRQDV